MASRQTVEEVQHEATKAGAAAARAAIRSIELPARVGAIREAVRVVAEEIGREADRLASLPTFGPDLAHAWRIAALEACRAELILLNAMAERSGETEPLRSHHTLHVAWTAAIVALVLDREGPLA
jgi:hypothetical protein